MDFHEGTVPLDIEGLLVDIIKPAGGKCPAEKLQGILVAHIYASVAHRNTEIIVPVGAMEGMALVGKETGPWHTHQRDDIICEGAGGAHIPGREFDLDVELSGRCVVQTGHAGGDTGSKKNLVIFVTGQGLRGQVYVNTFTADWHIRRERRNLIRQDGAQLYGWDEVVQIFIGLVLDHIPGFAIRSGIDAGDPLGGTVIKAVD